MAKNDFKAFATGENANTLSQEEYESLGFIEEGFKSGIARSEQLNKVWRQSSIIAAVIGKYIAEKTGEDVIDDGDLEKLVGQLDFALKQKITAEIPDASLTQKGISQLNNATNSDREDQAATPKAVNDVRKMAEGKLSSVADATLSQKGIVQLSSATDSANETLAATPKAVKGAYDFANTANVEAKNAHDEANRATDNANSRLAKNQNGADIPNKSEFIKNLGLVETVNLAKGAYPKSGGVVNGNVDATGYVKSGDTADVVSGQDIWAKRYIYESGLRVYSPNNKPTAGDVGAYPKSGGTVNGSVVADRVSARDGNEIHMLGMRQGKAWLDYWDGNRWAGEIYHPKKSGILATLDDIDAASNIPVGAPIPWPQPNPPSGYLTCNGQAFNKSTYPQLAAAYPSGRLPDLRGEFIRGWDDGRGVDSGRGILSWQADEFKSHTHTNSLYDAGSAAEYFGRSNWKRNGSVETGATGGNETRPRNIAFNYIVRAA